ncbi:hypothetical protein HK405_013497 [Cladochytrium tenue]|nr:hypothetical protein HK405_013497 [Cladochytrium tenue]
MDARRIVQNVEDSFTKEGGFKGEKVLGGILGAVAIAGVGYLGYEEWLKHHNKEHSDAAVAEFQSHNDFVSTIPNKEL